MSVSRKKAGVMGWPVAHSLSPALHGYWLRQYGVDGSYEHMAVPPEELGSAIRELSAKGFAGANVTVPHKEAAARLMDRLDDAARALGAVNLIIAHEDSTLEGRNTDGFGFVENLKACTPGFAFNGVRAVVLGAGGTAKAVAHALTHEGSSVTVANRTEERAHDLARRIANVSVVPWTERNTALEGATLLVNTTLLGMAGQPPLEIDLAGLAAGAVVADCVYAPLETELLRTAREKGLVTADGLGMLIHQARPAFKAWFGVDPEVMEGLRTYLVEAQKEMGS